MSFKVNWPAFSPEFVASAKKQLQNALNKPGEERPANIVDTIVVKDMYLGKKPPDLEILEIGDLTDERFRGIFKLVYVGDAYIVLQTKVQANPLTPSKFSTSIKNSVKMLAADKPLVVPMEIRISNVRLRGVIALVVDKHRGITLALKNDPLEKVDVNSTFDNIPNIRRFLQRQIENQLRKMFSNDLPQMVHNLSVLMISQSTNPLGSGSIAAQSTARISHPPASPSRLPSARSSASQIASIMSESDADKALINRPHHEKWHGNDPVHDQFFSNRDIDHGLMVFKSLDKPSLGMTPSNSRVGLQCLIGSEDMPKAFSRTMSPHLGRIKVLRRSASSTRVEPPVSSLVGSTTYPRDSILSTTMNALALAPSLSDVAIEDAEDSPAFALFQSDTFKFLPHRNYTSSHFLTLTNINYTLSPITGQRPNTVFRTSSSFSELSKRYENERLVIQKKQKRRIKRFKLNMNGLGTVPSSSTISIDTSASNSLVDSTFD